MYVSCLLLRLTLSRRKKQIETLCSNFSALVEVAPDAEYEVPFLVGSDVSALLKMYDLEVTELTVAAT